MPHRPGAGRASFDRLTARCAAVASTSPRTGLDACVTTGCALLGRHRHPPLEPAPTGTATATRHRHPHRHRHSSPAPPPHAARHRHRHSATAASRHSGHPPPPPPPYRYRYRAENRSSLSSFSCSCSARVEIAVGSTCQFVRYASFLVGLTCSLGVSQNGGVCGRSMVAPARAGRVGVGGRGGQHGGGLGRAGVWAGHTGPAAARRASFGR